MNWGSKADELFSLLNRRQLEAQGKAEAEIDAIEADDDTQDDCVYDFDPLLVEGMSDEDYSDWGDDSDDDWSKVNSGGVLEFGDRFWFVLPHGSRGRDVGTCYYKYQMVSGGIRIRLRRDKQETVANMWIEVGSIALAVKGGLGPVWEEIKDMLRHEGITIEKDIVSRVDIYSDFDEIGVDEFCRRFMDGSRITRARKIGHYGSQDMNDAFYLSGHRSTGFSIGGDIRLRVYDKRLEMKDEPVKWGVFSDKYNGIPDELTRVEFQLRRNALKEFAVDDGRIEGVDSYLKVRENLWRYLTTDWFRLTEKPVDRDNNHYTRASTWSVWERVQKAVVEVVCSIRRIPRKIEVNCDHLITMAIGCVTKAAIYEAGSSIGTAKDVVQHFIDRIREKGAEYVELLMEKHRHGKYFSVGDLLEGTA